jgi:hypothetical protein
MSTVLNECKTFFPVWAKNEATGNTYSEHLGWQTILNPADIN